MDFLQTESLHALLNDLFTTSNILRAMVGFGTMCLFTYLSYKTKVLRDFLEGLIAAVIVAVLGILLIVSIYLLHYPEFLTRTLPDMPYHRDKDSTQSRPTDDTDAHPPSFSH